MGAAVALLLDPSLTVEIFFVSLISTNSHCKQGFRHEAVTWG